MRSSHCAVCWVITVVVAVGGGSTTESRGQDVKLKRGRALFERIWTPASAPAPNPDGLGPLFNERSCIACHAQGGIGGAGPAERNIDLLAPTVRPGELPPADSFKRLEQVHPAFESASSIVLHKFSTDSRPYEAFRNELLGLVTTIESDSTRRMSSVWTTHRKSPIARLKAVNHIGIPIVWSQRNTTPLFGLGRIARIAEADIQAVALRQVQVNSDVSGRFTGRLGWRGQIDDLGVFVRSACATELGLKVGTHDQAIDPLDDRGNKGPSGRNVDLTHSECNDLTTYVASLPIPRRLVPDERQQLRQLEHGEALFERIGCAVCHMRKLGQVVGLYSDLLLHDLGEGLSDPSPAPPGPAINRLQNAYSGPRLAIVEPAVEERRREWKTPPLWGLRDSGPYLHDGRAETIEEAVLYHGGEATSSARIFQSMPASERFQLIAFLTSLAAPDPATLR
jgi:CxxC motif-containing protein (DUF1111 family)